MAPAPMFLNDKYSVVEAGAVFTEPLLADNKESEFFDPKIQMQEAKKPEGKIVVVDFGVVKSKQLAIAPAPDCLIFDLTSSDVLAAKNFEDAEEDFGGIYEVRIPRRIIATKTIRVKLSDLPKLKPYIDQSVFESEGDD